MKGKAETIYRFFEVFNLSRSEAYFVMFLSSAALIGAMVPALRSIIGNPVPEPDQNEASMAFYHLGQAVNPSVTMTDSLNLLMTGDTMKHIRWQQKSDSIRSLLSGPLNTNELDSVLAQTGDEPLESVSINSADVYAFTALPGIGPKLAERIIDFRNQHGPFRKIEDIKKVKGIGNKLFNKIKLLITL
jgi:competence ComEA-like helix-hairpin-helix protein